MDYIIAGSILCSLITAFNLFASSSPFPRFSNRIFAVYLLVSSYCGFLFILVNSGLIEKFPHLYKTAAPFNFVLPPLAYLYIRSVLLDETKFKKVDILHFLPFFFFIYTYIPFYNLPANEKINFIVRAQSDLGIQLGLISEDIQFYSRVIQTGLYTYIQWKLILRNMNFEVDSKIKKFSKKIFSWLKAVATINALYFVGFIPLVIFSLIGGHQHLTQHVFNLSLVIVSLAFLLITSYLLVNPSILYGFDKRYSLVYSSDNILKNKELDQPLNTFEREQRILIEYFESSKPYLNHGLSLAEVSVAIGVPQRSISIIINSQLGIRFSDFVNHYRLELAKEEIENGYLESFTLASLANKVGFSSVKTLTRTFNKELNMTPMEYAVSMRRQSN